MSFKNWWQRNEKKRVLFTCLFIFYLLFLMRAAIHLTAPAEVCGSVFSYLSKPPYILIEGPEPWWTRLRLVSAPGLLWHHAIRLGICFLGGWLVIKLRIKVIRILSDKHAYYEGGYFTDLIFGRVWTVGGTPSFFSELHIELWRLLPYLAIPILCGLMGYPAVGWCFFSLEAIILIILFFLYALDFIPGGGSS